MRRAERITAGLEPEEEIVIVPWWERVLIRVFSHKNNGSDEHVTADDDSFTKETKRANSTRVRTDMIRRMDDAPKLVTPSGFLSEGRMTTVQENSNERSQQAAPPSPVRQLAFADLPTMEAVDISDDTSDEDDDDSLDEEIEERFSSRPSMRSRYIVITFFYNLN